MRSRPRVNLKRRRRDVVADVHIAGVGHNHPPADVPLTHEDLNRVLSLKRVAEILGVHEATVRRNLAEQIERISKRRVGLRYRHVIAVRPIARTAA